MARRVNKEVGSTAMAVGHAREFLRQMDHIFHDIPQGKDQANEYFGRNPSLVVFFATNLTFTCELFLKSIYALQGTKPPNTHNVWALFKRLPRPDKENINRLFLEDMAKLPDACTMNLLLTKQPNMPEAEVIDKLSEDVDKPKGEFLSLERILKDTSDSYQTWRYLFQSIAETKQHRVLRFHWCHLHCFCTAMDRLLHNTEKMLINAKA